MIFSTTVHDNTVAVYHPAKVFCEHVAPNVLPKLKAHSAAHGAILTFVTDQGQLHHGRHQRLLLSQHVAQLVHLSLQD